MQKILFFLIIFFISTFVSHAEIVSGKNKIKKIDFIENKNIEISLSTKNEFRVFSLKNPPRIVIDIDSTDYNKNLKINLPNYVKKIRTNLDQDSLRIVFDLNNEIKIENSFYDESSNKITVQFQLIEEDDFITKKANEFEEDFKIQTTKIKKDDGTNVYLVKKIKKIPIIVIDAGHGGKDPGAIGSFARTKEKNITLSYAKELSKQLANTKKYKVYLTRDKDFFVPLKTRVEKSRHKKADLFISIHANSSNNNKTSGFSIYTLSEKSSDKQAEMIAQKENQADIINGINFSGASSDIMKTLIDLSQRDSNNSSATFANILVDEIKNAEVKILQNSHRFAGFVVLTSPDMASVLIELGYLSNKKEEELLNSIRYKRKISQTIVKAVDQYFIYRNL